jgi:hypothetical protein
MSYADLLKDPRWQKKRLEVLEAAEWACAICDDKTKTLHVHHRRYRRGAKPWEYKLDELQSLCEKHHEEATKILKRFEAIVDEVKLLGSPDLEQAIGYLESMVANGWRAVASKGTMVQVDSAEMATGVGAYVLCQTHVDGFIVGKLVDGKVDAYKLWTEFINTPAAHRRIEG